MAQPKRDRRELPARLKELDNLEKRTQQFTQRRNELNQQARVAREERDLLNQKKKELFEKMDEVRAERDRFNKLLQQHKEARNSYQAEAKALIKRRRGEKRQGRDLQSAPLRARELEHEVRELSYRQETSVLSSKEEEKLIKQIRTKRAELAKLGPELEKAQRVKVDLSDADQAIDTFFAKADEEHQKVVHYYKASQEQHERYVARVKELGACIAEANAKHAEFVELRKKSDEQHQKFLELRSKILELKGADRAERDEARRMIREHAKQARQAVADPKRLEEHADKALDDLKRGGKIRIG